MKKEGQGQVLSDPENDIDKNHLDVFIDLDYLTASIPPEDQDECSFEDKDEKKPQINDTMLSQSSMHRHSEQSIQQPSPKNHSASTKRSKQIKIKDSNELSFLNKRNKRNSNLGKYTQSGKLEKLENPFLDEHKNILDFNNQEQEIQCKQSYNLDINELYESVAGTQKSNISKLSKNTRNIKMAQIVKNSKRQIQFIDISTRQLQNKNTFVLPKKPQQSQETSQSPGRHLEYENADFLQTLKSRITNITNIFGQTLNIKSQQDQFLQTQKIRGLKSSIQKTKRNTSLFARNKSQYQQPGYNLSSQNHVMNHTQFFQNQNRLLTEQIQPVKSKLKKENEFKHNQNEENLSSSSNESQDLLNVEICENIEKQMNEDLNKTKKFENLSDIFESKNQNDRNEQGQRNQQTLSNEQSGTWRSQTLNNKFIAGKLMKLELDHLIDSELEEKEELNNLTSPNNPQSNFLIDQNLLRRSRNKIQNTLNGEGATETTQTKIKHIKSMERNTTKTVKTTKTLMSISSQLQSKRSQSVKQMNSSDIYWSTSNSQQFQNLKTKVFPKSELDMFESLQSPSINDQCSEKNDLEDLYELKLCQNSTSAYFASNLSKTNDDLKKQKSEQSLQFIDLKVVHEDFTTFRDDNKKSQIDQESSLNIQIQQKQQSQNLIQSIQEVENEKTVIPVFTQKNKLLALLRGFKLRQVLSNNFEILEYIKQIREYESQMKTIETDQQKFEILINLRTKKHIFIHSLHSLSRLKKHSKTTKFQMKSAQAPQSQEDINQRLMRKYLKNQKNQSVQIAFGHLFDSQSRYKVLVKKQEFNNAKQKSQNFDSNVSFDGKNEELKVSRKSMDQRPSVSNFYSNELDSENAYEKINSIQTMDDDTSSSRLSEIERQNNNLQNQLQMNFVNQFSDQTQNQQFAQNELNHLDTQSDENPNDEVFSLDSDSENRKLNHQNSLAKGSDSGSNQNSDQLLGGLNPENYLLSLEKKLRDIDGGIEPSVDGFALSYPNEITIQNQRRSLESDYKKDSQGLSFELQEEIF